jgi:hypothetical protein
VVSGPVLAGSVNPAFELRHPCWTAKDRWENGQADNVDALADVVGVKDVTEAKKNSSRTKSIDSEV